MRSLGGFILLAGLGVGLFVYLPAPVDGRLSLAEIGDSVEAFEKTAPAANKIKLRADAPQTSRSARDTARDDDAHFGGLRLRSFSPNVSLVSLARAATVEAAADAVPTTSTGNAWQAVVAPASGEATAAAAPGTSLAPRDASTRYKLITDIQQQLKRVGCYWGRVDGSWGASTKDAMRTFTDRVNAELPLDEPDYLLLTLLQSHGGKACGDCPPGLMLSNGRCVPQPVVAQSHPAASPQAKPQPQATSGAQQETLPWQAATTVTPAPATKPLFRPATSNIVSSEPLPGRMAIGGPKELPPLNSANADPGDGAGYGSASTSVGGTTGMGAAPGATALAATPPGKSGSSHSSARRGSSERHAASGSGRRGRGGSPGTAQYNLMLSLGGVY
jgi:hypothetical protein